MVCWVSKLSICVCVCVRAAACAFACALACAHACACRAQKLWPPVHEALPTESLKRKPSVEEIQALPEPVELVLEEGDALYLPRGVLHEAQTTAAAAQSLHLTMGLLVGRSMHTLEALLHETIEACTFIRSPVGRPAEAWEGMEAEALQSRTVAVAEWHSAVRAAAESNAPLGRSLRSALPVHRADQLAQDAVFLDTLNATVQNISRSGTSENGSLAKFLLSPLPGCVAIALYQLQQRAKAAIVNRQEGRSRQLRAWQHDPSLIQQSQQPWETHRP